MEEKTMLYQEVINEPIENLVITVFDGNQDPICYELNKYNKKKITFGRNKANDIVLSSSIISNFHGFIVIENGSYVIYDNNSTNGLFFNDKSFEKHILSLGDIIKVDNVNNPIEKGVALYFNSESNNENWNEFKLESKNEITIGRDKECDIRLNHISISKIHALIRCENNEYYIYDNDSTNGISVNGKLVNKKCKLKEKDLIIITNSKLIFTSKKISYQCYDTGVSVNAYDIVKTVKTKNGKINISNHISLNIKPCEFVAIIGGSGAGKTTFMNCISGYDHATSGEVLVNGADLYSNYEVLKNVIGYVPQQDIVYDNLTLRNMLDYAARLRMPKDTANSERMKRVQEVVDMVELTGREDFFIKELSGGQKKRASIAVELLSDPNLFFLDEPSSGLDPGTERNLMKTLKNMTTSGKTVILVTHNTLNLHLCDKIILLGKGGNLCFCGTPQEILEFFSVKDFVDIYNLVTENPVEWSDNYSKSKYASKLENGKNSIVAQKVKKKKQSLFKQTKILSKRYIELLKNDKQRMLLLLIQAPLLAVLIYLVSDGKQFKEYEMTKSVLFALSCCAFWIGILNSIQEICKERIILKREYLTGLKITAYIYSKVTVLGGVCFVQSLLLIGVFSGLVGITSYGTTNHAFIKMLITTFMTSISATTMGLFVSSLFKNADRAMTVAPILLMPQILFSGLVFKLSGISKLISVFVNCRWAMEGYGTICNLNNLTLKMQNIFPTLQHEAENFFTYTRAHLIMSWGIMAIFTVVFTILSGLALRNIDK